MVAEIIINTTKSQYKYVEKDIKNRIVHSKEQRQIFSFCDSPIVLKDFAYFPYILTFM